MTTYTYDAAGRLASVTDPRGHTTSFTYDWRGQVLSTTNADGTVVSFAYDAFGYCTNLVNELGHSTTLAYDEYNRLTSVTDALGRTTSYEYGRSPSGGGGCGYCGGAGNLISRITDPAGKKIEYSYDRSDKRTNETIAAGHPACRTRSAIASTSASESAETSCQPRHAVHHRHRPTRHRVDLYQLDVADFLRSPAILIQLRRAWPDPVHLPEQTLDHHRPRLRRHLDVAQNLCERNLRAVDELEIFLRAGIQPGPHLAVVGVRDFQRAAHPVGPARRHR